MAKSKKQRRDIKKKQQAQRAKSNKGPYNTFGYQHFHKRRIDANAKKNKPKLEHMTKAGSTITDEDLDVFNNEGSNTRYSQLTKLDKLGQFKVSKKQFEIEDEKFVQNTIGTISKYFMSDEQNETFFQNIINSGGEIQERFEHMLICKSKNFFPKNMAARYIWWVRQQNDIDFLNEELKTIEKGYPDEEQWHREHTENQLKDFKPIPEEQIEKLTRRLQNLIQPGTEVVENDLEAFANTHTFEQFQKAISDGDDPHKKLAHIEDRFFYDRTNEQAKAAITDVIKTEEDHENLFENMLNSGFQERFENMLAAPERCWLPEMASVFYVRWVAKKMQSDPNFDFKSKKLRTLAHLLADRVREKVAEIKTLPPIAEQVEVAGRILANGTASDEILPRGETPEEGEQNKNEPIAHIPWLVEAIQNHFDIMGRIKIYHPRQAEGVTNETDFAYRVIEFDANNKDGTHTRHQIAANNWKGYGTFVIKKPIEIDPNAPRLVEIGDLLTDGRAWPLRCTSREQYTQAAMELCKADIADLPPYIPNMGWRDKKQALMDAVYDYIKATGNHPKSSNNNPVAFGRLRGVTAWNRAYSALHKGSIKGLEGIKNFYDLANYMRENGYPDIHEHLNKPTLSAKQLFNDAAEIIEQTGIVPQEILLEDDDTITLAGVRGSEITKYFERSAEYGISHMDDVINLHEHRWPNSFDDFMIASGLAERDESGELVPAQTPQPA